LRSPRPLPASRASLHARFGPLKTPARRFLPTAKTALAAITAAAAGAACGRGSHADRGEDAAPPSLDGDGRVEAEVGQPRPDADDGAAAGPSSDPAAHARPDLPSPLSFLFITVDTLRPDLGYAGYERPVSPRLDELAKHSVTYERAYSISTYTAFSLPPMMASRYPSEMPRSDRHEVRYMGQNVLLAERLHAAGYRTAGAASHFLFNRALGWIDGFDRFVMTGVDGSQGSGIDWRHSSRPLADAAIRLLHDPELAAGPFFIGLHFLDPHKQYLEHQGFSTFGNDPRALYDGEIAFTDHHIGRVLDALAASPAAARTAILFTGDHGEAFGEHGFYFHGREIWDEVVRVPLLIHVPGAKPRSVARRTSTVDLAPTVLDLAGIAQDEGARGRSLVPDLFGGELAPRPVLIDQPRNPYYLPRRGFIDGAHKLHHFIDTGAYRLFDLDQDPGEKTDLSESQPELLRDVVRSYEEYTSKIVDFIPAPTGEPRPASAPARPIGAPAASSKPKK
jgi:arylsulfatase A-like enzyme